VIGEWALPTIIAHGSDEQREFFVRPTLRGDIVWCQLFSEPGAGSDLASVATRAERVEGGWLLNGQKVWTSLAHEAQWGICLCRTDPAVVKHAGLSYVLVDMSSPGVEVRPLREANGRYMFNEVFLSDVFVPDDRLVGQPGDGWKLARTTLGNERVSMGGGTSDDHPDLDALAAAGVDLTDPAILQELGAIEAGAAANEALGRRILVRQLSGLRPGPEASVRKVASSWHTALARRTVMGWVGPAAAIAGPFAQSYLSTPARLIGGGTAEIQLNVIAERVLGLPR
jgi:alkylation response protein AidB-like acyl-CoA dehydrogenase